MDRVFRRSYAGARDAAIHEAPVLVVLGDELILVREKGRRVMRMTLNEFHVLKAVAHAPVALFVSLTMPGPRTHFATLERRVRELRAQLGAIPGEARRRAGVVLDASLALASTMSTRAATAPREALESFAAAQGPRLMQLLDEATAIQLAALDGAMARIAADMSAPERASFEVVVTGEHQARTRSLACQYFRKLLAEPPDREQRVLYAEGATSVEEALTVIRTMRAARALARAFFGHEDRMQRDLLGDAAARRLRSLETKAKLVRAPSRPPAKTAPSGRKAK